METKKDTERRRKTDNLFYGVPVRMLLAANKRTYD